MSRSLPLVLFLLATGACDALVPDFPIVVSVEVLPSGPLARELQVTLREPARLAVRYWTGNGPIYRVESERGESHTLLIARLLPGRSYHYEVEGSGRTGTFESDLLPADLAAIDFRVEGRSTLPLVLVHLFHPDGFKGYAVLDPVGEVVWYWRTEDFPFGMARRPNGNFAFMDKGRGLVEVTPAGEVVHELPQELGGREVHHDLVVTPRGTVLFLAFDERPFEGRTLQGEGIWEWDPDAGTAEQRWSSWDFLSPDSDRGRRFGREWLHANSLAIGPRGNVLVSLHYINQVISIAPGWQSLEWRLGGVNATHPVPEGEEFSGQHTAREVAPGRIVLFDNGLERTGSSRAMEFDMNGPTVSRVWEWEPTPGNRSTAVSSARRLESGNTLVAFGLDAGIGGSTGPTEAYEVTADGEVVWHLVVDGVQVMFRAEPLTTIAGEEPVEP